MRTFAIHFCKACQPDGLGWGLATADPGDELRWGAGKISAVHGVFKYFLTISCLVILVFLPLHPLLERGFETWSREDAGRASKVL